MSLAFPDRIERYQIVKVIASGGMAQVYEALATGADSFQRRVAIKRILPEFADEQSKKRMFLDEARIACQLYHANIVQVLDFGVVEGSEFLVMEYIDGIDLALIIKRLKSKQKTLSQSVALHIATEIAHALDYVHNRCDENGHPLKIVHRDVSPQNVLLSWDGDVKLSDFGIAKATGRVEKTTDGAVKGKEHYMAPEQALGNPVTGAADVFALGVTLHMMLSGVSSSSYGVPSNVIKDEDRHIPGDIADFLDQCLAQKPEDRPTALEIADITTRLRTSRTHSAGRTELRNWLEPFKNQPKPDSAFDQLLSAYLVKQVEQGRVYSLTREDHPIEEKPSEQPKEVSQGQTRSRKSARIVIAGAVVFVALLSVSLSFLFVSNVPEQQSENDFSEPTDNAAPLEKAVPSPTDERAQKQASDAQHTGIVEQRSDDTSEQTIPPTQNLQPNKQIRRTKANVQRNQPDATAREGTKTSTSQVGVQGWIRVGGSLLQRARIELDGRTLGHAPLEQQVPVGRHRLVARDLESGETLFETVITVNTHHRRASPLRVIRRSP